MLSKNQQNPLYSTKDFAVAISYIMIKLIISQEPASARLLCYNNYTYE